MSIEVTMRDEPAGAVVLRPITPEADVLWLRLRESLFPDVDRSVLLKEMALVHESDDAQAFFCEIPDGRIAGMLEVTLRPFVDGCPSRPVGYIDSLFVEPQYRGRDLGREIVERAAEWFESRGCSDMATDADLANKHAQDFFRSIGFSETFRIVQFKRPLRPTSETP